MQTMGILLAAVGAAAVLWAAAAAVLWRGWVFTLELTLPPGLPGAEFRLRGLLWLRGVLFPRAAVRLRCADPADRPALATLVSRFPPVSLEDGESQDG